VQTEHGDELVLHDSCHVRKCSSRMCVEPGISVLRLECGRWEPNLGRSGDVRRVLYEGFGAGEFQLRRQGEAD
jgi:hypothetical protein